MEQRGLSQANLKPLKDETDHFVCFLQTDAEGPGTGGGGGVATEASRTGPEHGRQFSQISNEEKLGDVCESGDARATVEHRVVSACDETKRGNKGHGHTTPRRPATDPCPRGARLRPPQAGGRVTPPSSTSGRRRRVAGAGGLAPRELADCAWLDLLFCLSTDSLRQHPGARIPGRRLRAPCPCRGRWSSGREPPANTAFQGQETDSS